MSETEEKSMVPAIVVMALCIVYDISPVDIIPDVPVIGWIDDFFITVTGGLNLLQVGLSNANSSLAGIVKFCKWAIIILGIIACLLVVLLGAVIVKMFM